MFLLYYAKHLGYLLHTMFQSLGILQHYTKFDTCTITSLEKLLGAGSYGGYINHLTCHHAILLVSSSGFGILL